MKKDVQNVSKITKSTKKVSAHHTIHSVSLETFMTSVSVARTVTTSTQLPDAEFLLWAATMLMECVLHAELHSFIKDKLPPASLMGAKNTSLVVVKLVLHHMNLDTTHAS